MRYTSVKSLAVTLSLVVMMSVAAPAAEARVIQPSQQHRVGIVKTIRQMVNRFFGGVTAYGWPTIPIPREQTEGSAQTTRDIPLPTDSTTQD